MKFRYECRRYHAGGAYPKGATPEGAQDLAGNVWEWTRSRYAAYPYPSDEKGRMEREDLSVDDRRVLRGGAFHHGPRYVRCACRGRYYPVDRGNRLGFRVVVSPFSGH